MFRFPAKGADESIATTKPLIDHNNASRIQYSIPIILLESKHYFTDPRTILSNFFFEISISLKRWEK